jgi:hypothetical protein
MKNQTYSEFGMYSDQDQQALKAAGDRVRALATAIQKGQDLSEEDKKNIASGARAINGAIQGPVSVPTSAIMEP